MSDIQTDPHFNVLRNVVLPDAKKQPDRYLAIVMAAVIDDELCEALVGRLVHNTTIAKKLFTGLGPLSSFSSRIDLGFMLGMYHADFANMLRSIKDIRNQFAHNKHLLSFSSPEIKRKAGGLDFMNKLLGYPKKRTDRELFISACEGALGGLSAIAMDKKRLRTPERGQGPCNRFFAVR